MKIKVLKLFFLILVFALSGCERLAWREATKKNSVKAYQEYLDQYPSGEHAKQAWAQMDRLSYRWALRNGSAEAYQKYLHKFPNGEYVKEVRKLIISFFRQKVEELSPEDLSAARLVMETTKGRFVIRLFPESAPGHCRNIVALALAGFYNGTAVDRAEPDRVIIMGDPRGDALGGPGYMIPAEINELKHRRGIVSMWHLPVDPNTAGSRFFICLTDLPEADGQYTVFGEVVEGMEVVDEISRVETTGERGKRPFRPLSPLYIKSMKVEGIELES